MSNKNNVTGNESMMVKEPQFTYNNVDTSPVFTKYQMQILESIANVQDEEEMQAIRNLIADYFSNKALDAMDRLCNEGTLSTQDIESWNKEHLRTPYKY